MEALPKSTIGKALSYRMEKWQELMIYATDCKLNIDNPMDSVDHPVENSTRPMAVGRKNYLFAGSHQTVQKSAMLYSVFKIRSALVRLNLNFIQSFDGLLWLQLL
jgi:transposase